MEFNWENFKIVKIKTGDIVKIADVANWKRHQRLDIIFISFYSHYVGESAKLFSKKLCHAIGPRNLTQSCSHSTHLLWCARFIQHTLVHKNGHISESFLANTFADFQYNAGKNQDFFQSLVTFEISNICYWAKRGGGQLNFFSGRGVRPGFPKCGACELTFASEKGACERKISKFGGLWAENFQIWGLWAENFQIWGLVSWKFPNLGACELKFGWKLSCWG